MAQENSVSFKCYLQGEGLNEVRRFGVDKDVVCNFSYLKGKLQAVFPSLQGRDISVAWRDSDGDEVVISSDDELMIALTEQQTDVRKLYVSVKQGSFEDEQVDGEGRPQHVGVTCDGCNKGVEGFRYKCIQCPDFDLCATCESRGLHAQHYMIRMPIPTFWRPHFGKRLAHHLNKAAHKAGQMDGGRCPFSSQGDGRSGNCHFEHHGGRHHRGRHGGWMDTLAAYLNEWSLPDDDEDITENRDEGAGPSDKKQQKTSQKEDAHVQYLRNIGKTVANLLDPLGIDVDVEVRTKDKHGNASKAGDGKKNGNEKATEEQANAMEVEVDDKQNKNKEPQSQTERDQSPESEGWTVLSPQQSEQNSQQQSEAAAAVPNIVTASSSAAAAMEFSVTATSAQTAATTATTTTSVDTGAMPKQMTTTSVNSFYPNLYTPPIIAQPPLIAAMPPFHPNPGFIPPPMHTPIMHPPNFADMQAPPITVPEPMQHTHNVRPHVAEAVEKMMSMGFSNDGGWLTQLLESKNGDIIKALDVLQPVKRS